VDATEARTKSLNIITKRRISERFKIAMLQITPTHTKERRTRRKRLWEEKTLSKNE
jgi:hypothetical protein